MQLRIKIPDIFFVFVFLLASTTFASEPALLNTGFINGGIWFSKDPFYAGEAVRIYTKIFNGSGEDLTGEIQFEDNGKMICKGDFSVVAGRTNELWCDWTAVSGTHKISAKIMNASRSLVGKSAETVSVANSISGYAERVVGKAPASSKTEDTITDLMKKDYSTSTTELENTLKEGLYAVQKNVESVAPKEITKDDILTAGNKVLSYVPEPIANGVRKAADSVGLGRLAGPLSYVVDFFAALYKFIIGDPLLLIILASMISWSLMRYIYKKTSPF